MDYSFRFAERVLLCAPSHRQNSTYPSLCYTSHGTLAGMRNSSMASPWRIDLTTHRAMHEMLLPQSYITLHSVMLTFSIQLTMQNAIHKVNNLQKNGNKLLFCVILLNVSGFGSQCFSLLIYVQICANNPIICIWNFLLEYSDMCYSSQELHFISDGL